MLQSTLKKMENISNDTAIKMTLVTKTAYKCKF